MKSIAIFGAGGFGKEVASLVRTINKKEPQYNLVGFFDDGKPKGTPISHFGEVLGGMAELNAWSSPLCIVIAIGKPSTVKAVRKKIINNNISFPNLIHPNFFIYDPDSFTIGEGNIIQGSCAVTNDVMIGNFNVFNGSVVVGHDVTIGDYNTFMPATRISGEVKIGECNLFGVHSVVFQQLKVGNHVTLAPGSVLMTKPRDGQTYMGVPAKLFRY